MADERASEVANRGIGGYEGYDQWVEKLWQAPGGDQVVHPADTGERGRGEMADGEFYEPADHAGTDNPNRFDISGYRSGLFGGPGADLFGDPSLPSVDRAPNMAADWANGQPAYGTAGRETDAERSWSPGMTPQAGGPAPHGRPSSFDPPVTETGSLVRPYTRTGGRTRPDYDLAIEALVSTSDRGWDAEDALLPEHRSICGLCVETRSVAEVAAHLRLPLGVVRVLIGDMAGLGLVVIHSSGSVVGDRPSMDFLERVLSGLRRL